MKALYLLATFSLLSLLGWAETPMPTPPSIEGSAELAQCYSTDVVGKGVQFHQEGRACEQPAPLEVSQSFSKPIVVWIPKIGYLGGGGRSYEAGYETAGLFAACGCGLPCGYPFIDLEAHRVGSGRLAANLGLGWRGQTPDGCNLFGANVFYDYRRIRQGDFHQLGLGAEFLGQWWDFRINGYLPIGLRRRLIDTSRVSFSPGIFTDINAFRSAMWGLDVEMGRAFCASRFLSVYMAIGPYAYSSLCCNTFIGGMGRVEVKAFPYFTFGLQVTHDQVFHTKLQGQITFSLFSPKIPQCRRCDFLPLHRNPIIVLEDLCLFESSF